MKMHLKNWTITGYWPYTPILNKSVETGVQLRGVTKPMQAENLSDVYTILRNYDLIPDPYYSDNTLACEWVKERWWLFENKFYIGAKNENKHYKLSLYGLDYEGDIHINGKFLCHHKGPFIPLVVDIDDYIKYNEENKLSIMVYNAPVEYAQIGYTSKVSTQRSRFDYNWDFCTRLVGIGIYGPAFIEEVGCADIVDAYVKPRFTEEQKWVIPNEITLGSKTDLQQATVKSELFYDDTRVAFKEDFIDLEKGENNIALPVEVKNPNLWWPNNHGNQPIYKFKVTVLNGEEILDSKEFKVAFRTLEYVKAEGAPSDSLPYTPLINGRKIYIKGVNLVPFDLAKKFPEKEVYDKAFEMLKNANINFVRIWGGGILESEYFYDLCDKYGIMVWQEFIQSSSGIDNTTCKDPDYLELLAKTAEAMIKQRRNHVALTLWCGGNELFDQKSIVDERYKDLPVSYDDENITMLNNIVKKFDPDIMMMPSSASGPHQFLKIEDKGRNHDVHGPWKYKGTIDQYYIYNGSDSLLHSEFGCDGMCDFELLKEFLPPEKLIVNPAYSDYVWNHHGGDLWDTVERESEIFGEFKADELETFVKCSQFIQAEGIRYALQSNMRRAFKNCGSIIWQFNEPWPNVSCTSLVSYGLVPKLAYFFTKDAFESQSVTLKYDTLCWESGKSFKAEAFVFNEKGVQDGTVVCEIVDTKGELLYKTEWDITAKLSCKAGDIEWEIPKTLKGGFIVKTYFATPEQREAFTNKYLFLLKDENGFSDRNTVVDFYNDYIMLQGQ